MSSPQTNLILPETTPLVRFHRLITQARLPQRADRAAGGTIPTRAARFCDAVTAASGFGYYVFPPMELSLLWDGTDIFWSHPGHDGWIPLEMNPFPGFPAAFDAAAPADLAGDAPPFLTRFPEPGHFQLWTGLIARTAPEWSLLIRPVANFPQAGGIVAYEGIVETDRWFGPLFTNLRMTRTHTPVRLNAQIPIVQVQPLPRTLYTDPVLDRASIGAELAELSATDWEDFRTTIALPARNPDRPLGAYAVRTRRRRRCPMGG
jgi:hypothetical protein